MSRHLAAIGLASLLGLASLALGACSDEHMREGRGASGGGDYDDPCAAYASCGACTPILGCGWCERSDGTTACLSGPGQCSNYQFRWTWEPAGCGVAVDAGPAPDDASPPDDAVAEAGACLAPDTGADGCVQTTGGTLCAATEATVACHFDPAGVAPSPAASAGCRAVSGPAGADARYWCCPCAK